MRQECGRKEGDVIFEHDGLHHASRCDGSPTLQCLSLVDGGG